jgi:hypothetical protein
MWRSLEISKKISLWSHSGLHVPLPHVHYPCVPVVGLPLQQCTVKFSDRNGTQAIFSFQDFLSCKSKMLPKKTRDLITNPDGLVPCELSKNMFGVDQWLVLLKRKSKRSRYKLRDCNTMCYPISAHLPVWQRKKIGNGPNYIKKPVPISRAYTILHVTSEVLHWVHT